MRTTFLFFLLAPIAGFLFSDRAVADETDAKEAKKQKTERSRQAINKAFAGRVIRIKKKTITIYYDFEDEGQLKDFEEFRPPRLLDLGKAGVSIQGGRLFLDGSVALRHKMEASGMLRAHFYLRPGLQKNIGTIFTEPVISDFFTVLNLFDERFYKDGALLLASCGLHEDEGAGKDMALVNWRDIVRGDVRKHAKAGADVEVEVYKDGWKEFCRVGKFKGKGSSKGKGKRMAAYQFGFWCDHSRMSVDDLTLTLTLTDEFLDLNDLKAEVEIVWEEIPESGPFAGISQVPPRLRRQVDDYQARKTRDPKPLVEAMGRTGLPKKVREIARDVLSKRGDPKIVRQVIDGLYSEDKTTRKFAIAVIKSITGKTWGLSAGGSEKKRREAIKKLSQHMNENRRKYYD